MRAPSRLIQASFAALLVGSGHATAQEYLGPIGSPVDRNVADASANAASLRITQPGLGQFGVGSLLLDRYDERPYDPTRLDPFFGDPRTSQRYLMQSPGVTAFIDQTNYIGPSPRGGWTQNGQTFDGAEILTLSGANTVFVLSPELLQRKPTLSQAEADHPNLFRTQTIGLPQQLILDTYVNPASRGTKFESYGAIFPQRAPMHSLQSNPNYVHPEIIERRRKLKAEREAMTTNDSECVREMP